MYNNLAVFNLAFQCNKKLRETVTIKFTTHLIR